MKYMGSKRWMLQNGLGDLIAREVRGAARFVDLFSGSGAVSTHVAMKYEVPVTAYDLQTFSTVLTRAVVGRGPLSTTSAGGVLSRPGRRRNHMVATTSVLFRPSGWMPCVRRYQNVSLGKLLPWRRWSAPQASALLHPDTRRNHFSRHERQSRFWWTRGVKTLSIIVKMPYP